MIKKDKGFIVKIILIIVAIIALKYYFHIDVISYLKPIWAFAVKFYNWLDVLVKGWVT